MHILRTHTLPTCLTDTYLVYWSNSTTRPHGILQVRVANPMADSNIVAELAALQHLLEVKKVIGSHPAGNKHTHLIVSAGAIRKLQRRQSGKKHLAPYANFLTTRFAGCRLSVAKDSRWCESLRPDSVDELLVNGPHREMIKVPGIGDVAVTQHVLEQFTHRFLTEADPDKLAQVAWKMLVETAADSSVREVSKQRLWPKVPMEHSWKKEGRYFLNAKRNMILVVTDNPLEGKRLVTTYPANRTFHNMKAA
jgi:hypothetical protein